MLKLRKKLQTRKLQIEIAIEDTIELWKALINHLREYGLMDLIVTMYDQRLIAEMERNADESFERTKRKLMSYSMHIVPALRELGKTDDEIIKVIMTLPEFGNLYNDGPVRYWFENNLWRVGMENEVNDLLFTLYDKGYYEYEIRNELMNKYGINEEQASATLW